MNRSQLDGICPFVHSKLLVPFAPEAQQSGSVKTSGEEADNSFAITDLPLALRSVSTNKENENFSLPEGKKRPPISARDSKIFKISPRFRKAFSEGKFWKSHWPPAIIWKSPPLRQNSESTNISENVNTDFSRIQSQKAEVRPEISTHFHFWKHVYFSTIGSAIAIYNRNSKFYKLWLWSGAKMCKSSNIWNNPAK